MPASDAFVVGLFRAAVCVAAAAAVAGCQPQGGNTANPTQRELPPEEQLASLPLGDIAGAAESKVWQTIENPYAGNREAVAQGSRLFIAMNCAGCHGYDATGGMGPDLTDKYWRYGGTPAAIYRSIFEGRPQGMPSWGRALPPQEIWKIVTYVETFGGSFPPQLYHAGLQGDHDVTSVAPGVNDLGPTFDKTRPAGLEQPPVSGGALGQAPELARPGSQPRTETALPASQPNAENSTAPPAQKGSGGLGPNSNPPGPSSRGSSVNEPAGSSSPSNPDTRGAQ